MDQLCFFGKCGSTMAQLYKMDYKLMKNKAKNHRVNLKSFIKYRGRKKFDINLIKESIAS